MTEWITTSDINPELHKGKLIKVGRNYSMVISESPINVKLEGIEVEECVTIGNTHYILTKLSSEQEYHDLRDKLLVSEMSCPDTFETSLFSPHHYVITAVLPNGAKHTFAHMKS